MRSQLFVHRNSGQDIEDMVDLDGPPIEACPPLSCTALNTLGIAPVAATLGMMPYLPDIVHTPTILLGRERELRGKDRWARRE